MKTPLKKFETYKMIWNECVIWLDYFPLLDWRRNSTWTIHHKWQWQCPPYFHKCNNKPKQSICTGGGDSVCYGNGGNGEGVKHLTITVHFKVRNCFIQIHGDWPYYEHSLNADSCKCVYQTHQQYHLLWAPLKHANANLSWLLLDLGWRNCAHSCSQSSVH